MTEAEMNRRLNTMTDDQRANARRYFREGFSDRATARECGITLKQANAVAWQLDLAHRAEMRERSKPAMDSAELARNNID